jgi:hypothetical protein
LNPCRTKEHLSGKSPYECLVAALKLLAKADIMVQISDVKTSLGMQAEEAVANKAKIGIQNWVLDQNKKIIRDLLFKDSKLAKDYVYKIKKILKSGTQQAVRQLLLYGTLAFDSKGNIIDMGKIFGKEF